MNINEQKTELLPIVIEGQSFKSNAEGLWSLNEIHQTLGLPESKRPGQWNNEVSDRLLACGNFHKVDKVGSFADELATIAYAMWVSTDFYLTVAGAFVTMRNDAILSARMSSLALTEADKLLADNIPKATTLMLRAKAHGISWTDACRAAQVERPLLAKDYLLSRKKFRRVFDHDKGRETVQPVAAAFQGGFFKRQTGMYGNADGWKVTHKGVTWLSGKAKEINEAVQARHAAKRKLKAAKAKGATQCATS